MPKKSKEISCLCIHHLSIQLLACLLTMPSSQPATHTSIDPLICHLPFFLPVLISTTIHLPIQLTTYPPTLPLMYPLIQPFTHLPTYLFIHPFTKALCQVYGFLYTILLRLLPVVVWMKNGPCRYIYLNGWSSVSETIWEGLGGIALWEDAYY